MAAAVDTMVLRRDPGTRVVRVALGLGAWLAEPMSWAAQGVPKLLEALLEDAPDAPLWFTTSLITEWRRVSAARAREEILAALPPHWLRGRPRHFFSFEVSDDPQLPSFGLAYREVDPARAARPSTVELTLAQEGEPARLLHLARRLADIGPFLAAVGGYAARWNRAHRRLALAQVRVWCKRYLGLDVQDVDEMAWRVPGGLPGSNWLTFVGDPLADRLKVDLGALVAGPWSAGVEAERLPRGLLLRAGPAPVLGDVNRGELPSAYAEVARRLASAFVKDPPEYWTGPDEEDTAKWLRRLVEPEGWQ